MCLELPIYINAQHMLIKVRENVIPLKMYLGSSSVEKQCDC